MTVSTYNPAEHAINSNVNDSVNSDIHADQAVTGTHTPSTHTCGHDHSHDHHDHHHSHEHNHSHGDDIVHLMPTLTDLQKPHSDQEFIEKAMAEERSNHKNLIASSRD